MKDIALDLYRKWYRWRHPAQAPLLPDDSNMPRSRRIKMALDDGDFRAAEEWADRLLAFPEREREDEVFKGLYALLPWLMAYGGRWEALSVLNGWQQAFPESRWPARLELLYWAAAATERRGQEASSEVSDVQWQDAWVIGQVLFLKGFALLGEGMDWFVAHTLGRHAQIFSEPDWAVAWCYGQDVSVEQVPAIQALIDLASPVLIDGWRFDEVSAPSLPAQRPASLVEIAPQVSPEAPSGFFWLMVGMSDSPHGFYLVNSYACLRTERWGGDEGEILTIADSPLCRHLTDDERQQLRSIQWEDEATSLVFDDPYIRDIDKRARKILKRGDLSPEVHSQMLQWVHSRLYLRWPAALQKTPLYQWWQLRSMRRLLKAGKAYQVDDKLRNALEYRTRYGRFPDEQTELLVPICYYGAPYAALYGVFCDNGWGGLKQDRDAAQQWYAYAVRLSPPGSRFGDMEYGTLTMISEHFHWSDSGGPLWNLVLSLAEAGYADAQLRAAEVYSWDQRHQNIPLSLSWYRAALRDGQPDTYQALLYIGTTYIGRMEGIDPAWIPKTTPLSRSAYGMDAYLEFLERMSAHPVEAWTPDQRVFVDKALVRLRHTIALWPDHHAAYLQPILHLLARYADELRVINAAASTAYIRAHLPAPAEWERAARAIVYLRRQYPDHDDVAFVYGIVRDMNEGARQIEFDRIAASL
ncbi:DUF4034 domain-containing protein [Zymobacter palmae]|uniref:1,4-alpha-glucan branching enzyme n=1 Tax=Zymobacter palmae TaxID=33074 RepID=A0A348HHB3_9GAMM|nr:DUF4034 domain-containing protein [Zymobacter palmae]BBG31015.1 1,4-alpha-glucan branching enzyme [Zymobacter palmae]